MTLGWRDHALKYFAKDIARLTLVADPDGLLNESIIQTAIGQRGFSLLVFDDPIHFRYAYERNFRKVWDNGQALDVVLAVKVGSEELEALPYDLLERGRRLYLSLADIFPALSYPVIKELDVHDLDKLYAAYPDFKGLSSDSATCEFILRRVYSIDISSLNTVTDLLQYLLMRHYGERYYPKVLDSYILTKLSQYPMVNQLPLSKIVPSRVEFLQFLASEWTQFLLRIGCVSDQKFYERDIGIGTVMPFDQPNVRSLLDNYFTEGLIPLVNGIVAGSVPTWARAGVANDTPKLRRERLNRQVNAFHHQIINANDRRDWQSAGKLYGDIHHNLLTLDVKEQYDIKSQWQELLDTANSAFTCWMDEKFAGLIHVPYLPQPTMLHHIPHFLAAKHGGAKIALIVIDGMNYPQWNQMRCYLSKLKDLEFDEHAVFAWVPTVTSVSRQALFAGESPLYFADDMHTTAKDSSRWKRFWQERKIVPANILYKVGLGKATVEEEVRKSINDNIKVAGLVINSVDDIIHGATQGDAGAAAEIGIWLDKGYLINLLTLLWDKGFVTYITSDHGNVEALGIGRPAEGILAETKGERMRIYKDNQLLKAGSASKIGREWSNIGLPPDTHVLLANSHEAFINEGDTILAHGGVSIQEVIVPFVKIWRTH